MSDKVRGTQGYADEADELFVRYESYTFERTHAALQAFIPPPPGRVLDVGAGTGRDAAWFADAGYAVVAIEPCGQCTPQIKSSPRTESTAVLHSLHPTATARVRCKG